MNRRGFLAGLVAAVVAGPASLLRSAAIPKEFAGVAVPFNSATGKWGNVKDIYISEEALADIRACGVNDLDEQTRKEIFTYGRK